MNPTDNTRQQYVFIVGLPRTGTKLLINSLMKSSNRKISIAPETHFVGHFLPAVLKGGVRHRLAAYQPLQDDANMLRLARFLYSGGLSGTYWRRLAKGNFNLSVEEFGEALLRGGRTEKGVYETILRVAAGSGKVDVMGDKTPSHLFHIDTLLEWFPEAKILHTFRDPRAIIASELTKRNRKRVDLDSRAGKLLTLNFVVVLHMSLEWWVATRLHARYAQSHPDQYELIRFEDLVLSPRRTIERACRLIDIPFDEKMLDVEQYGSSFDAEAVRGFNRDAVDYWRDHLPTWLSGALTRLFAKRLVELGYAV